MSDETRQPTEEELRALMEEQVKRLRVEEVLLESAVSLVNLGARRAGLVPGSEDEVDPGQLRDAIDGADALMGLLGRTQPAERIAPLRDAIDQLKLAYAKVAPQGAQVGGSDPAEDPPPPAEPGGGEAAPQGPGPAQSSGRLWVPGT